MLYLLRPAPFAAVAALAVLAACASKNSDREDPVGAPPVQTLQPTEVPLSTYFADNYALADADCQSRSSGAGTIATSALTIWKDAKAVLSPQSFVAASSQPDLHGLGVLSVTYGIHQQLDCGSVAGTCADKAPVNYVSEGSNLHICNATKTYSRTSYEGVALRSLATIEGAYGFYQTLDGHHSDLPAAALIVLPEVEYLYGGGSIRAAKVDNLSYVPNYKQQPGFVIYPKGAFSKKIGRWSGLNLWEVPWTLAHEFGHHVFRTHSGIENAGAYAPLHSIPDDAAAGSLALAATRTVTNADLLLAVNEGYADLYAYYVAGSAPGMTAGIDCFHDNRDPGVKLFANGAKKVLTADIVSAFLSADPQPVSTNCSLPYFQDVHTIGAIVAYGVDQIFSAAADNGSTAATAKAALLLKWAERLGSTYAPYKDGAAGLTLGLLVRDAVLTAAAGAAPSAAVCAAANSAFPTYTKLWCQP